MNATVKDISRSGISFYAARAIHPGLKVTLTINGRLKFHGARIMRCEPIKPVAANSARYLISATLHTDSDNCAANEAFLCWVDSQPSSIHLVPPQERRNADRKETHISLHVDIPLPKVVDNQFYVLPNGVHCMVDQYIPPFHEITVSTDSAKDHSTDVSGVVVRCEELETDRFELDVFFPKMPQNWPTEPDVRIAL